MSGDSLAGKSSGLPADVLFAQKASAVSKCAGLDPRSMDLEKFRSMAPLIFHRAYCAIYRETLSSTNPYTNEEDAQEGAQLVIEKLLEKTSVSALQSITGADVCNGSHRAIGVLVGVLFAEGQRMWIAKQEEKRRQLRALKDAAEAENFDAEGAAGPTGARGKSAAANVLEGYTEGPAKKAKKAKKKPKKAQRGPSAAVAEARAAPEYNDAEFEDYSEETPQDTGGEPLSSLIINQEIDNIDDSNPSPKDVKLLISRIQYLESQLKKKAAAEQSAAAVSRGKIRRVKDKEQPKADVVITTMSNVSSDDVGQAQGQSRAPADQEGNSAALPKAVRPSSAPSVGRKRPPQRRLYAAEGQAAGDLDQNNGARLPPVAAQDPAPLVPSYPSSWYTYNMSSGRRILLSEAEREANMLRKKREAMGNVINKVALEVGGQPVERMAPPPRPADPVPRPTQAEWPGTSTGKSTEDWVK